MGFSRLVFIQSLSLLNRTTLFPNDVWKIEKIKPSRPSKFIKEPFFIAMVFIKCTKRLAHIHIHIDDILF